MASLVFCARNEAGALQKQKVVTNSRVGFVLPYYGETAPPGTLACDGSEISREAYKELFNVIGTLAGEGDGSMTFNLPDLRGQFVRGLGGTNSGELGVEQGDAIRNMTGGIMVRASSGTAGMALTAGNGVLTRNSATGTSYVPDGVNGITGGAIIRFDASNQVPTADENRPVNVALLWCIIYE